MNELGKKRLKIALIRRDMNVSTLAKRLGIGQNTLYRKIRGDGADFTCDELKAVKEILGITSDEWMDIFFAPDAVSGE